MTTIIIMSTGPSFLGEVVFFLPEAQGRHKIGPGQDYYLFVSIVASFHHKKLTTVCHALTTLTYRIVSYIATIL